MNVGDGVLVLSFLLLAGCLALAFVDLLIRNPAVGAALVLSAAVLSAALGADMPRASLGGAHIHIMDAVSMSLIAAATARYIRKSSYSQPERLLLLLGLLALISLARGLLIFDIESAANEFRRYLRFIGFGLYFASFGDVPEMRTRIWRLFLWGGAGMIALVALRWAALVGGAKLGPLAAAYDAPIRVVSGTETFFLAQIFLLTLPAWQRHINAPKLRMFSAILGIAVVVLNRRTVWLALLAALCVVIVRNRQLGRRLAALLLGGAVVLGLIVGSISSPGDDQLAQSASSVGTLSWRIQGWSELFEEERSFTDWVIGRPFGASFERAVGEGRIVVSNPHSFYVETLLRLGIVGVVALAWMVVRLLRAFLVVPTSHDTVLNKQALLVLLTAQMVWWITWDPGPEQGILVGLAVGAASGMSSPSAMRRAKARTPVPRQRPSHEPFPGRRTSMRSSARGVAR